MQDRKLPQGHTTESYPQLVQRNYFVDKTKFISQIIKNDDRSILFTRPRRWGKTLFLKMLECFFDCQTDYYGDEIDCKSLFSDQEIYVEVSEVEILKALLQKQDNLTNEIFQSMNNDIVIYETNLKILQTLKGEAFKNKKLEIIKQKNFLVNTIGDITNNLMKQEQNDKTNTNHLLKKYSIVNLYQGKYPVIFISFRQVTENKDPLKDLKITIKETYEKHYYLVDLLQKNIEKNDHKKDLYELDLKTYKEYLYKNGDMSDSIKYLSYLIAKYLNKKCVVLIDEYDRPLFSQLDLKTLKHVFEAMKVMFANGLKNNQYVERTIAVGVTSITQAGLLSGANNFINYGLNSQMFSDAFGFTVEEVDPLLKSFDIFPYKDQIMEYYGGYNIGDTLLVNTWSFSNLLNDLKNHKNVVLKPYWVNTGAFNLPLMILDRLKNHDNVINLIKNGIVKIEINQNINYECLYETQEDDKEDEQNFFTLLFISGYLTKVENNVYKIPNREIRQQFQEKVLKQWMKNHYGINDFEKLRNEFITNLENDEQFKNALQNILNLNNTPLFKNESELQTLTHLFLFYDQLFNSNYSYQISEDPQSGYGRPDGVLFPVNQEQQTAYIFVYKQTKNGSVLTQQENGIWQIYINQYLNAIKQKMDKNQSIKVSNIIVRVIVYSLEKNKWKPYVKTFRHNIGDINWINKIFTIENEKINDPYNNNNKQQQQNLIGRGQNNQILTARRSFLESKKVKTIEELLNKIVNQSKLLQIISNNIIFNSQIPLASAQYKVLKIKRPNLSGNDNNQTNTQNNKGKQLRNCLHQ